jgi:glycosyltransferase involved in cell wall biosynthesis
MEDNQAPTRRQENRDEAASQADEHMSSKKSRRIVFVAWRDLANRNAGGSELLVDRLAHGLSAQGDQVTLLCGGETAERDYEVRRSGGTYSQFLRAPFAFSRHLRDCDLVVEVCNGMPYLTPLWAKRPVICLVNHVHTELWSLRFPPPVAAAGRLTESVVMPWAHRKNLFVTVSASTFGALTEIGVDADRIRLICNGVEPAPPPAPRSAEPLFLALGRLAEYKRIDVLLKLWDRVRSVTGGKLVIAGDGPERNRLTQLAGPDVVFTGRVSEGEKHRLLSSAWILLHPASIEGWGIVVAEAAVRGTPAIGFCVPGLRDSVVHNETGLLVKTEGEFASAWATLAIDERRRQAMGHAARERALQLHWSVAVEGFSAVADEALARARVPDYARSPVPDGQLVADPAAPAPSEPA